MEFSIRQAQPEESYIIMDLVIQLAEFENSTKDLISNPEKLAVSIENGLSEAYFAELDGNIIGLAFLSRIFSTFMGTDSYYLQDLFILENYRSQGYGKKLLEFVLQLADKNGYRRVFWETQASNTKAQDFYNKLGANPMNDWILYRYEK